MMRDLTARLPFNLRKELRLIDDYIGFVREKFLFDSTKEVVSQVTVDENCLYSKAHMVFVHNFITDSQLQPVIEDAFKRTE